MSCKFSLKVEYFTNKKYCGRKQRLECILKRTNSRNVDNGPNKGAVILVMLTMPEGLLPLVFLQGALIKPPTVLHNLGSSLPIYTHYPMGGSHSMWANELLGGGLFTECFLFIFLSISLYNKHK